MNLLNERWLNARSISGTARRIAPYEITSSEIISPLIALENPRPDFNGALMQFLIGLLQTAAAPETNDEWWEWFESQPTPEVLREKFDTVAHAFELSGDGPRFMQDLELRDGEIKSISNLFVEAPGGNTLRNNQDHFVKRDSIKQICQCCATAALFALQTNAPSGGVGHRVSLRGGGPLTTLVLGDNLWQTLWLNVLPKDEFISRYTQHNKPSDIFPWLALTRTSEGNKTITPVDAHPAQMYWGMPRRIRLDFENIQVGNCDICEAENVSLLSQYQTKNYGVSYNGWEHVLTPHTRDKNDVPLPRHPQPGGITYRHWLGLVHSVKDDKNKREPARLVQTFLSKRYRDAKVRYRLWAFGYDFDNMKARAWYESVMPLVTVSATHQDEFEEGVRNMVIAATETANNLKQCLKNGLFGQVLEKKKTGFATWRLDPNASKADTSLFEGAAAAFWQRTEVKFFSCISQIRDALEKDIDLDAAFCEWHKTLCSESMHTFDQIVDRGIFEDSNIESIVVARSELWKFNYLKKIVVELLRLPQNYLDKNEQLEGGVNELSVV